jgi:hypothetical protein
MKETLSPSKYFDIVSSGIEVFVTEVLRRLAEPP